MKDDDRVDIERLGGPRRPLDASGSSAGRVRFAEFELDLTRGELWRDGARCPLRPMAMAALCLLVENRHRLVTREELRRHLWGDSSLEWETGLHQVIRQLRRALGDDAGSGGFIVTIPRRGYAWVAPLAPVAPETVADAASGSPPCGSTVATRPSPRREGLRRAGFFLAGIAALPLGVLVLCLLAQLLS